MSASSGSMAAAAASAAVAFASTNLDDLVLLVVFFAAAARDRNGDVDKEETEKEAGKETGKDKAGTTTTRRRTTPRTTTKSRLESAGHEAGHEDAASSRGRTVQPSRRGRTSLRAWHVVAGQTLGFTVIVAASAQGYAAAAFLPPPVVGLLGILPLGLGAARLREWPDAVRVAWGGSAAAKEEEEVDEAAATAERGTDAKPAWWRGAAVLLLHPQVLNVALTALSNGSDNLSIYIPLLAQCTATELAVTVVVFYGMLALWLGAAAAFVSAPPVARFIARFGALGVPFLLMGLGVYILVDAGTVCLGAGCTSFFPFAL